MLKLIPIGKAIAYYANIECPKCHQTLINMGTTLDDQYCYMCPACAYKLFTDTSYPKIVYDMEEPNDKKQ